VPYGSAALLTDNDTLFLASRPDNRPCNTLVREGSSIHTRAGDNEREGFRSKVRRMCLERKSRDGEIDRFQWFCPRCDALLQRSHGLLSDYRVDPVSKAYQTLFDSEDHRICEKWWAGTCDGGGRCLEFRSRYPCSFN
jgi:uncharacterized C2H2 Zn-finger protein